MKFKLIDYDMRVTDYFTYVTYQGKLINTYRISRGEVTAAIQNHLFNPVMNIIIKSATNAVSNPML